MRKVRKSLKPVSLFMAIFMMVLCSPLPDRTGQDDPHGDCPGCGPGRCCPDPGRHLSGAAGMSLTSWSPRGSTRRRRPPGSPAFRTPKLSVWPTGLSNCRREGDALGAILIASIVVFVILLITDIMGYTDLFPFVKKKRI